MDYNALSTRIRQVRIESDFTQAEFAKHLHFSPKHVGNIERGTARPSLECLVEIANSLDISTDYLLQDSLSVKKEQFTPDTLDSLLQFLIQQEKIIQSLQKKLIQMRKFSAF